MWEWNETAYDGINNTAGENRDLRGGSWTNSGGSLDASTRDIVSPANEGDYGFGLRVAMVPEPSALSLLAVGLGGLAVMRRRRGCSVSFTHLKLPTNREFWISGVVGICKQNILDQ